jgi:hypothetical protein
MQERNARPYQSEPSREDAANESESAGEGSSQSDFSPESPQGVEPWIDGFVKPDGTRIQLFVPRSSAA